MVKIPTFDNYGILNADTKQAYSNVQASPQAFGASVGQATQGFAQQVGQSIDTAVKIKNELSTLAVEDKWNNETSQMFRDLDNGFMKSAGKNTIDGYESAIKQLDDIKSKSLDGLTDPFERRAMETLITRRAQQSQDAYARHLQGQMEVYKQDTFNGSLANSSQSAIDFAFDDKLSDQHVRTGLMQIENFALENGKPLEWAQQKQREFKDRTYGDIVKMKMMNNPSDAMAYLATHQDKISPEVFAQSRKTLQPHYDANATQEFIEQAKTGQFTLGGSQNLSNPSFSFAKVPTPPSDMKNILTDAAKRYSVPPQLAINMGFAESGFNPKAVGSATKNGERAGGIIQIMPATARELGITPEERFDPVKCADAGMRYFSKLMNKYDNNLALSLAAYNAGFGNVDKAIKKAGNGATLDQILNCLPKKSETIPYIKKILGGLSDAQDIAPSQSKKEIAPNIDTTAQATGGVQTWPPKTKDDLLNWYNKSEAMIAQKTNDPNLQSMFKSGLSAEYKRIEGMMNDRMQNANNTVMGIMVKDIASGQPFDLPQRMKDPAFAEAWGNMTPQAQLSVLNQGQRQAKQQTQEYKDASKVRLIQYKQAFIQNPDMAKSFDVLSLDVTPDDAMALLTFQQSINKNGVDKPNDPLWQNEKQGMDVFDEQWQSTLYRKVPSGKDIADGGDEAKKYLYAKGLASEMIKQAQTQNGGKPLSAEEQRKITLDILAKKPVESAGFFYGVNTKDEVVSDFMFDLSDTEEFKTVDKKILYKAINDRLASGQKIDKITLRKALTGK